MWPLGKFTSPRARRFLAAVQQVCSPRATYLKETGMVLPSNRAIVSTGTLIADETNGIIGVPQYVSHDLDVAPQHWTNGYLIAVDSMFLGGRADAAFSSDVYISVTMECTVETLSQAAAMALSLSQQGA